MTDTVTITDPEAMFMETVNGHLAGHGHTINDNALLATS